MGNEVPPLVQIWGLSAAHVYIIVYAIMNAHGCGGGPGSAAKPGLITGALLTPLLPLAPASINKC